VTIAPYKGSFPHLHDQVYIAPGSRIIGDVSIEEHTSIWYNAVLRADVHSIKIGKLCNIQDNCVLHVTHKTNPLIIGDAVTIGHAAILHGCTIENLSLIGMGATILDGAVVHSFTLVAAGALVPPGMHVPSGTLVAGIPARPVRNLRKEEKEHMQVSADHYYELARHSLKPWSQLRIHQNW